MGCKLAVELASWLSKFWSGLLNIVFRKWGSYRIAEKPVSPTSTVFHCEVVSKSKIAGPGEWNVHRVYTSYYHGPNRLWSGATISQNSYLLLILPKRCFHRGELLKNISLLYFQAFELVPRRDVSTRWRYTSHCTHYSLLFEAKRQ